MVGRGRMLWTGLIVVTGFWADDALAQAAMPSVVTPDSAALARMLDNISLDPNAGDRAPNLGSGGSLVFTGACPGEYCSFGEWQVTSPMILRAAPNVAADSIGFIGAQQPFCAISSEMVVDPPGVLAVTRSPPGLSGAPFAPGDSVLVLDYLSEGYWRVIWRGTITVAYQYWLESAHTDQVAQYGVSMWWVQVRDPATGRQGWIMRNRWADGKHEFVDGGPDVDDRAFMRTMRPC